MDLFYGNRRSGKKQYAYDIYGDFEEVEIDEQKIIDDALSCIKNHKEKQKAGIKDITLQQFVAETSINLLDRQEKRIIKLLDHPIWELESRIKELSKELSSTPDLSKQTDLELYSMALQRKQATQSELQQIKDNLNKLEEQMFELNKQRSLDKQKVEEYRAQQAIDDEKFSEIRDSYNNIRFGPNLTNSTHLLYLIDAYIKEKTDKNEERNCFIENKLLEQRIIDHKNLIRVQQIKLEYQIRELESIMDDKGNNIIKEIRVRFQNERGFNDLLQSHTKMKLSTSGSISDLINHYVVLNEDSGLGQKLEKLYPNIFMDWKSLATVYKVKIDATSIELNHIPEEEDIKFKDLMERSHFYRYGKIIILPSFKAIRKYTDREKDLLRIILIDTDGIGQSIVNQNGFRFNNALDRIKIFDGYDFFIDLKIIFGFNEFDQLSIEI